MHCHQFLFTLFLHETLLYANGNLLDNLERKVAIIKQRDLKNYGNDTKITYKLWELEMDDSMRYPRRDKKRLSHLSNLWSDYYTCSLQEARSLVDGRRSASILAVLEGAIARIPCGLCVAPGERVEWEYAHVSRSLYNLTYTPLLIAERMVLETNGSLLLQSTESDSGVYRCLVGGSHGALKVFEVLTQEDYNVVKPARTRGPYPTPPVSLSAGPSAGLVAVTAWSPWSKCSCQGHVARRRRYGICTVRLRARPNENYKQKFQELNSTTDIMELFQVFPDGIPCRSRYLPGYIKNNAIVKDRKSEIMIGLCKVKCKPPATFEVHSADGRVLERVNNSAGEYSLQQTLPWQPPAPLHDVLFIDAGEQVTLKCPGMTLEDVPVTWQVGTRKASPRALRDSSGGRVYVNARDHFMITKVDYSDDNLYSCWSSDALLGTIKLIVRRGANPHLTQHLLLIAFVLCSALLAKSAYRLYRKRRSNLR